MAESAIPEDILATVQGFKYGFTEFQKRLKKKQNRIREHGLHGYQYEYRLPSENAMIASISQIGQIDVQAFRKFENPPLIIPEISISASNGKDHPFNNGNDRNENNANYGQDSSNNNNDPSTGTQLGTNGLPIGMTALPCASPRDTTRPIDVDQDNYGASSKNINYNDNCSSNYNNYSIGNSSRHNSSTFGNNEPHFFGNHEVIDVDTAIMNFPEEVFRNEGGYGGGNNNGSASYRGGESSNSAYNVNDNNSSSNYHNHDDGGYINSSRGPEKSLDSMFGSYVNQPLTELQNKRNDHLTRYDDYSASATKRNNRIEVNDENIKDPQLEMKRVFGHTEFREGQRDCIEAALNGRDVFCLMPTGGGKSMVYQLPAWCCPGLAVVFSPLVSLIQDQVDAMNAVGVRAAYFCASQGAQEVRDIMSELFHYPTNEQHSIHVGSKVKHVKLLYLTPERYSKSQQLKSLLNSLLSKGLLSRFIIDEAHCMSQWGHDFRPDYLSLQSLKTEFPSVPIMALTATANKTVMADSIRTMKMRNPFKFTMSFNRPNLRYTVTKKGTPKAVITAIASFISDRKDQTGIIYCLSTKDCENVSNALKEEIPSMKNKITFYHAKLTPDSERERRQREWSMGKCKVIVATIAFGMGINKPDVRYVIHHSLPKSLDGFSQESGRAGRDGHISESMIYYSFKDAQKLRSMIYKSSDERGRSSANTENTKRSLDHLSKCIHFCDNEVDCRRKLLLNYFGEDFDTSLCQGTCDNCRSGNHYIEEDVTEDALKIINFMQGVQDNLTLNKLTQIFTGSKAKDVAKYSGYGSTLSTHKKNIERLLQLMIMEDVLEQRPVETAAGFSADYVYIGVQAAHLNAIDLFTHKPKKLVMNVKSDHGKPKDSGTSHAKSSGTSSSNVVIDIDNEDFTSMTTSTSRSAVVRSKSQKKSKARREVEYLDEDEDDEEFPMEMSTNGKRVRALPESLPVARTYSNSNYDRYNANSSYGGSNNNNNNNNTLDLVSTGINNADGWIEQFGHRSGSGVNSKQTRPVPKNNGGALDVRSSRPIGDVEAQWRTEYEQREEEYQKVPMHPGIYELRKWLSKFRLKRWGATYYHYLTNDMLTDLCNRIPQNAKEFLLVRDSSEAKLLEWGDEVLATLHRYFELNNLLHLFPKFKRPDTSVFNNEIWKDPTDGEEDDD